MKIGLKRVGPARSFEIAGTWGSLEQAAGGERRSAKVRGQIQECTEQEGQSQKESGHERQT